MFHKKKFNNSYESEPSSRSASPACDNNSCEGKLLIDEKIPKLSDLLKPSTFNEENFNEISHNKTVEQLTHVFNHNGKGKTIFKQDISSQESNLKAFQKIHYYNENNDESDLDNSPSPGRLLIDEENDVSSTNEKTLKTLDNSFTHEILFKENSKNNVENLNERSPDLFDCDDDEYETSESDDKPEIELSISVTNIIEDQKRAIRNSFDTELLNRIKDCLSGLPPPPSVRITQTDLLNSVLENKENILNFFTNLNEKDSSINSNDPEDKKESTKSIFYPSHTLEEVKEISWPEILNVKCHGLCYNVSNVTEKIELLSMSVAERYIGAETSSSFHPLPTNCRRTSERLKSKMQSPGSRLSHLARRRAAFSSATLQSAFQNLIPKNVTSRQILIGSKKSDNHRKSKIKTPKRRTPGKLKIVQKQSSSTKKRFQENDLKPGPSRETSKRALFQSPSVDMKSSKVVPKPVIMKPEIANRVEKSKRALFSPEKPINLSSSSTLKSNIENGMKRKRSDTDDENISFGNPNKMIRTDFDNLTPRSLKFKSQSFCIGVGTSNNINNALLNNTKNKTLVRASSENICSGQLTESHKKKLLWAVSQALQTKQIGVDHAKFKQYASVLVRAVKRLFLEFYLNMRNSSTSETMLKLSKKYVHYAVLNISADDIYLNAKNQLEQEKKLIASKKLSGYISSKDYENIRNNLKKIPSAIFSDNSCDSFNLLSNNSQNSQLLLSSTDDLSQISQDSVLSKNFNSNDKINLKNQKSKLQNSTSKSNLYGIALRENVDCEQRKSAQKNFIGKHNTMKNTSPYIIENSEFKLHNTSSTTLLSSLPSSELNKLKVKRQISFDN